jgi:hypothetical protein
MRGAARITASLRPRLRKTGDETAELLAIALSGHTPSIASALAATDEFM